MHYEALLIWLDKRMPLSLSLARSLIWRIEAPNCARTKGRMNSSEIIVELIIGACRALFDAVASRLLFHRGACSNLSMRAIKRARARSSIATIIIDHYHRRTLAFDTMQSRRTTVNFARGYNCTPFFSTRACRGPGKTETGDGPGARGGDEGVRRERHETIRR